MSSGFRRRAAFLFPAELASCDSAFVEASIGNAVPAANVAALTADRRSNFPARNRARIYRSLHHGEYYRAPPHCSSDSLSANGTTISYLSYQLFTAKMEGAPVLPSITLTFKTASTIATGKSTSDALFQQLHVVRTGYELRSGFGAIAAFTGKHHDPAVNG